MSDRDAAWLSARQASERLGIKLATLYAYASRGLISSVPGAGQRARSYAADDVERLRARHSARSGHGPVAAGALRFGEPVLETSVSDVGPDGPRYRGQLATELCRSGVSFERVAELLWTGSLPDTVGTGARLSCDSSKLWSLFAGRASLPKMALMLGALALADSDRHAASDAAEFARARALFHWLAYAAAARPPRRQAAQRVAGTLLAAFRVPQNPNVLGNVDRALVLCAEHELNASAFAARVAASAGCDLYACLGAAVHTLSGSGHGGMCDRVEALIANIGSPARAARTVQEWLARGERVPGFGHPLYAAGDPRGALLVELAEAHGAQSEPAKTAFALLRAMKRGGHPPPTLDAGLVTLCHCLALPVGSAASIFAVGRSAGWVAHALEQRAAGYLLRPRARYVG
ncbi:MAG TPA: citrate/2-methylcitrate synthase [Polyangiaceae bacterium]|nr:citrate/2-methylcitrate synthase [Polyangiaceae bacterium]